MKNTCEWLLQQFSLSARPISCVAPILAYKILSFLICAKMHSLIYFKILFLETSLKYISRLTVSLETRWKLFYESLAMYVCSLQKRIQNSKSPISDPCINNRYCNNYNDSKLEKVRFLWWCIIYPNHVKSTTI